MKANIQRTLLINNYEINIGCKVLLLLINGDILTGTIDHVGDKKLDIILDIDTQHTIKLDYANIVDIAISEDN